MTNPNDHLLETVADGVATLTMNRPEARNALSAAMSSGLEEAIPRLARDPKVRVVVLTGAGGAFCAGGDVKGFARADRKAASEEHLSWNRRRRERSDRWRIFLERTAGLGRRQTRRTAKRRRVVNDAAGDGPGALRPTSERRAGGVQNLTRVTTFPDVQKASTEGPRFEQRVAGLRAGTEIVSWLHEMPKPTLAAIPGPAAGGGLSLALACDIRIAAASAKFTTAFAKLGLAGDYGGSYFLPRLVGAAKARELYFTAELIDARQAERMGLVNHVYDDVDFPAAVDAWKRRLADLPTMALGYMKKNLNAADRSSLDDVLDLEARNMTRTFDTEDHRHAAQAFVDKRNPKFRGR